LAVQRLFFHFFVLLRLCRVSIIRDCKHSKGRHIKDHAWSFSVEFPAYLISNSTLQTKRGNVDAQQNQRHILIETENRLPFTSGGPHVHHILVLNNCMRVQAALSVLQFVLWLRSLPEIPFVSQKAASKTHSSEKYNTSVLFFVILILFFVLFFKAWSVLELSLPSSLSGLVQQRGLVDGLKLWNRTRMVCNCLPFIPTCFYVSISIGWNRDSVATVLCFDICVLFISCVWGFSSCCVQK